MNWKIEKLTKIKSNPNNPRLIKDDKFFKLVNSIKEFPKMLEIRPIVVNKDMVVLGGNMRLKACKEAGLKEVPIIFAEDLNEEEQKQFIIKDNVGFGEWDWEMIANEWDSDKLEEWGLGLPEWDDTPDYGILDDDEVTGDAERMTYGVKKAIQIEFNLEHYDAAFELVKWWREQGAYVGGMIMEYLKNEKEKNEKN